jgi:hypothetical protein
MPVMIYCLLTFDFEVGGKSIAGGYCPMPIPAGQNLPVKGKILPGGRQFVPGSNQKRFEDLKKWSGAGFPGRSAPLSRGFDVVQPPRNSERTMDGV